MHNYLDLSLVEINKLLKEKKITPKDLVLESFERIEKDKKNPNTLYINNCFAE